MENLFLKDTEIKATKSPFSRFENEVKVYDGAKRRISVAESLFKVNTGKVRGIDFIILEALSELEFATSRMVTQFLNLNGYEVRQMKVSEKLKKMNKMNIITRFKFKTDESEINSRFYCLEKAGKYILQSREIECKWKASDNTKPIYIVKRILARNQIMLSYMTKVEKFERYIIKPYYRLMKSASNFKPHLEIELKEDDGIKKFWFEIIRDYDRYEEKLIQRMKKYEEYYEYYNKNDEVSTLPQLVIVGEDTKHIVNIVKNINRERIKLKDTEIFYTTDLQALEEELNRSVYKLEYKDKKAKLTLQNLEILNRHL